MELNSLRWCLLADGHAYKHAGDVDFRVTPDGLSSRVERIRQSCGIPVFCRIGVRDSKSYIPSAVLADL